MRDVVADALESKLKTICEWKDVEVVEMSVQPDHVHLVCNIPPKLVYQTSWVYGSEDSNNDVEKLWSIDKFPKETIWKTLLYEIISNTNRLTS